MSVGRAIYNRLSTSAAVTQLIGDRLYPKVVPERTKPVYPLAIYLAEDQDREGTYGGGSGLASAKVTVAVFALTPAVLLQLRQAVLDALDEQTGKWAGVEVQGAFFEDENDLSGRDPTTGEESQYVGSELQFLVWYET